MTAFRLRLTGLVVLIVSVVVLAVLLGIPSLGQLRQQFAGAGLFDAIGFAALYAAVSLLPLPATVLTIAAGAVFGIARGLPIVIVGASAGALVAFYLGRVLGRDAVQRMTGTRLQTVDALMARRGFWTVLTLRLIPVVPFNALNYLSGLTAVRPSTYLAATVLGIVPAATAYVAAGAYGARPGSWPFLTALAALALLSIGGIVAKRRRRTREPEGPVSETSDDGGSS